MYAIRSYYDEQKEVISIGGSSFNITERKNYEHKINTLNKQIEFILQGTDTIVITSYSIHYTKLYD